MSDTFKARIRSALADPNLQTALDNNSQRRRAGRLISFESLPEDLQVLRQRAHTVRADVIAHLDDYMDEFIRNASANGLVIHQARDAAEAVQVVLDIARQKDARLIAKSKSMLSEEIHLNPALEAAGLQVVETDLGEYIVQLRNEPPAHIITPAVHLRRQDVGQTFEDKLGLPYTEDIPTMTAAARQKMRQVFLDADIGISGVNFGVAESGTIALVSNEGNGRMVVSLPPVHIALMGIERLLPTLDDLALMLYLLPRYATGQKLSVYVSLVNSPTPLFGSNGIQSGSVERHLVLIDNGRKRISQSPLAEALYCIRCGSCLNACPVFREIGGHAYVSIHGNTSSYPGPIGSVISPALFGQSDFGHLARASSLCGECKDSCPVDIDLPRLLLRVRAGMNPATEQQPESQSTRSNAPGYLSLGLRMFTWIAVSPWRFAAAQRLAGVLSRLVAPSAPWIRLPAFTGWGYSKDIARPAYHTFHDRWKARQTREQATVKPGAQIPLEQQSPHPDKENLPDQSLVEQFSRELEVLGGNCTPCRSSELADLVLDFLRQRGITRIQTWEAAQLPVDIIAELQGGGILVEQGHDADIQAGLTGADGAIAETGTLVITDAPGRPITASLVPEIHLAVLEASKILAGMPAALKLPGIRQNTNGVLISGPSRTADIEMTLTVGMHGPGEVHVYCLTDR